MKMAQVLTEEFAISKVFAENFSEGDQSASCDEILDSNDNELGPLSDLPPDAEIEFFEDDSWCGYNLQHPFWTSVLSLKRMMAFRLPKLKGLRLSVSGG